MCLTYTVVNKEYKNKPKGGKKNKPKESRSNEILNIKPKTHKKMKIK